MVLPLILSTVASVLPSIISALIGSPTEDEAKAKVAPERDAMVDRIAGTGMERSQAEKLADELITSRVHEEMNKGGIPPWLEGAAAVAGGLGGWKAGSWLSGKLAKGAAAKLAKGTAATAAPAVAAPVAAEAAAAGASKAVSGVDEAAKTMTSPFVKPIQDPAASMGRTTGSVRTLSQDEMPTVDVPMAEFSGAPVRSPFAWADETMASAPKRNPMAWADDTPEFAAMQAAEREGSIGAAKKFAAREDDIRRGTMDAVSQVEARERAAQMAAMRAEADAANRAPDPRSALNWPRDMKMAGPFFQGD